MEPFEMAWNLGTIIVALVFAEWFFIRRSTKKAIKVIREEFPVVGKVSQILKDPDFIDVVCDTLDTLHVINLIFRTFFVVEKPKEVVENAK